MQHDDILDHSLEASELLKSMGNAQRLRILCLLNKSSRALAVNEIKDQLDIGQSALSQHLANLRHAGLVVTRRKAQTIYYSVAQGPTGDIISILQNNFCNKDSNHA